jgi:16S rRNA (cytosine967-C5)-methyltransferase
MKIYKNLVNSIALTLSEIFKNNKHADKAIESLFKKNPQWGSRDRRFVAEGVYDVVRNYRWYSSLAESENNFWFITGVWLVIKQVEIPDWPEFKHLDRNYIFKRSQEKNISPAILQSYPDWLWHLAEQELGKDKWLVESTAMNQQAQVYLRVNTLKSTADKLITELKNESIEAFVDESLPTVLTLSKRTNIFKSKVFKNGWFEVQDKGSQAIGTFLNPLPSELVIDACAGAGGKSLHLAALMKNKGKVISMDVENWKLEELKRRAKRAGAFNIEAQLIDSAKTISRYTLKADKLLLDVPCSGLGVLKRNPDTKWKLNPQSMQQTKEIQKHILSNYSQMLKIGGEMVYSTCSILPSENQEQVQHFLNVNNAFELVSDKTIFPHEGGDGFYMAKLKRVK